MAAILAGFLAVSLFIVPLIARIVFDRRVDRANRVAADVRAAVRRRLCGESFVTVDVRAPGLWTPGRILLSAPRGYHELIEKVWPTVARSIPAGYELVVRPARAVAPTPIAAEPAKLSRAA